MPMRVPPQAGQRILVHRRDVAPVEQDAPGSGALQPGQHHQQAGLARAGRADDTDRLARREVEVDPAQDVDRPRRGRHGQVQVPDLHQRNRRRRSGIHGGTLWRPRPVAESHHRTGPAAAVRHRGSAGPIAGPRRLALRRLRPGPRRRVRGAARHRTAHPRPRRAGSSMARYRGTRRPAAWRGSTGRWATAPMPPLSNWARTTACAASIPR